MAKRILIVDDEPNIRMSLEMRLSKAGYEVELAANGQEALVAYQRSVIKKPFNLILLDIIMPGLSGLEVLEMIRQDENSRQIADQNRLPIIMLTALKDSWQQDAESEGCHGYIVKPFKSEELLAAVKKFAGKPE